MRKTADAIIQAAQEVQHGKWDHAFVVDVFQAGAGVSFHMNTNEVIANRASELLGGKLGEYKHAHPNDHVNYGQSTNDVFPTAMRLATLLELEQLYAALDALIVELENKGKEFHHILKSGRTHMMDAVPMRLGQEFTAYAGAIRRATAFDSGAGRTAARGRARRLGGRHRHQYPSRLSREGRRQPGPHFRRRSSHRWMTCATPCSRTLRCRRSAQPCAISRSRSFASPTTCACSSSGPNTGLAEINLPALQPGSSIMPGKINPVMAEFAAMVSFQVIGYDTAVALAVQAGQLELNVMMPTMAHSVLTSITIMTNMLRQLTDFCVKGITANEKRCEFYAQSTVSLATALNPYIGYAKAAEIAKESVATGKTIIEIARSKGYLSDAADQRDPRPCAHDRAAASAGRRQRSRESQR